MVVIAFASSALASLIDLSCMMVTSNEGRIISA